MTKLREFLRLVDRTEKVLPDKLYRQIGVRVWGNGAYERESILGCNTKYKVLSKVCTNDLIVNKIWARNGSIAIVTSELDGLYCSSEFPLFVVDEKKALLEWVRWLVKTPWFWKKCMEKSGGTSGKNRIAPNKFLEIDVDLPTLDRQTEISSRLDNSVPPISALESTNKENSILVRDLRQSILQYAVSGKLVPQDPNDEPAFVILTKIKADRKRLVKEKNIRKEKDLPQISQQEIPYNLPNGWVWARLVDLIALEKNAMKRGPFGGSLRKEIFVEDGYLVYEQRHAIHNDFEYKRYFITPEKFVEMKAFKVSPGDLIISCSGTLGKISEIPQDAREGIINQALLKIKLNSELIRNDFFMTLFNSPIFQANIYEKAKGSAITNMVGVDGLKKIVLGLPPLPEQERIQAKTVQLMSLCDELDGKIKENEENSEFLMETVLKEAFPS